MYGCFVGARYEVTPIPKAFTLALLLTTCNNPEPHILGHFSAMNPLKSHPSLTDRYGSLRLPRLLPDLAHLPVAKLPNLELVL